MTTARRSPVGFVNIPGNGLDTFETETSPLLKVVDAYPQPELHPPTSIAPRRELARPRLTFRHRVAATLRGARAVALFPVVVLSWFLLRIWWAIRLALSGVWHAVTGKGRLIAHAFAARAVVYGVGRALARGAVVARAAIGASVRRMLDCIAFAGTRIAQLTAGPHHSSTPVVRMADAGVPRWVPPARLVPVVAILVSVTAGFAVGMAMLLPSQRDVQRVATPAPSAPIRAAAAPSIVTAVAQAAELPPPERRTRRVGDEVTPVAPSLSPARVRDLWSQTDTRSLDRALTSLRRSTLAFQRCEMRVMSDDRAVAHCDEAAPGSAPMRVAWTIDFRRDDGRWLIDDLSAATLARVLR